MSLARVGIEFAIWLPVRLVPIANGIVRMATYGPALTPGARAAISTAFDIVLIVGYAAFLQRRHAAAGIGCRRGLVWVVLSTANHFLLGHFAFGLPWRDLIAKYDMSTGETWGLNTAAILAAPTVAQIATRRRA